jgi:predicted nucleotidyltransferase
MAQYGWADAPAEVRAQITNFADALQALLGENLAGVYLHGSLTMGCFNPQRSDIDLLAVTEWEPTPEAKRDIAALLLRFSATPGPFEISFLSKGQLHPWRHPAPYDLHYGEDWRATFERDLANGEWQRWNDRPRTDPDLAAHITMLRSRGLCLRGGAITQVFPAVPAEHYISSILDDFRWARERMAANPVYFILNACRVYAYLLEGHGYSKDEGGVWAAHSLPAEFHSIVTQALEAYRGGRGDEHFLAATLDRFAAYMDERMQAWKKNPALVEPSIGSKESIEHNGGQLENEIWVEGATSSKLRYWIDIEDRR